MNMNNYVEFTNQKLVDIYDAVNPIGEYADFYTSLAKTHQVEKVIDLGCGTGLLSNYFIDAGFAVIGIEPAPAMLEKARQKYGNSAEWLVGSTEALDKNMQADMVVMSGHVAQFFLENTEWQTALKNIRDALKPGGILAFESRNPAVRPFTNWPSKDRPGSIDKTPLGKVAWWPSDVEYDGVFATYRLNYRFIKTGEIIVSDNKLRFRTAEEMSSSLEQAGFKIKQLYGDWDRRVFSSDSEEMIFIAQK